MTIDWNWFFSSFCQSAAALIGIIAAFIISRLLGLSEKIEGTISHFDNLVIEANRIITSISKRHFIWYTKTNIKYDSDLKDAIRKGEFDNLSEAEILEKIYSADNRLFRDDNAVMDSFKNLYDKVKPKEKKFGNGLSMINTPLDLDIPPVGLWDKLSAEKEAINQLEIESKTIIQHFEHNLQDLQSYDNTIRPLQVIIVLLMIAFPLTVIYPLHFMPVGTNEKITLTINPLEVWSLLLSFKSAMLFIFFITIEGIFCYFLILINQLNKMLMIAKQNNSDDLRNIENYSKYFKDR